MFNFVQSPQQGFYYFNNVTIDGIAVEPDDWVGAFNGDVCVGSRIWDTSYCDGICEVPVMGEAYDMYGELYDWSEGYMQPGQTPTFKVFDTSENIYYDAVASENIHWFNMQQPLIDNLNVIPDCNGNLGGTAWVSDCGCVDADNSGDDCDDCAGTPNGDSWVSDCGCVDVDNSGDDCFGCTDDSASNYDVDATIDNGSCLHDMSLDLHYGANLVSMYTLPEDLSISNIMSSLDVNVSGVISEGTAASLNPEFGWVGSLAEVSPLSGYWIMMDTADEFQLNGSLTDPNSVFSLHYGANLLSFPFEGAASISETLPDSEESFINGIIGEGVAANQVEPGWWAGSLQTLQGGSGYWFIVDEAFDFSYIPPVAGMARVQSDKVISLPPSGFEYVQSTQQAFYFINEIEDVKAEDWVIAYNGNTIIGSRQWNGQYTDVPAMGYDENINSAGYCEAGDNVRFKLYQAETGELLDLHSNEAIQNWSPNGMVTVARMTTNEIPDEILLLSAYPNPFNPSTEIQFTIPSEMDVKVHIVNMQGRHVQTLMDNKLMDGYHHISWNASEYASGVYFVRLNVGGKISVQKILLMK